MLLAMRSIVRCKSGEGFKSLDRPFPSPDRFAIDLSPWERCSAASYGTSPAQPEQVLIVSRLILMEKAAQQNGEIRLKSRRARRQ